MRKGERGREGETEKDLVSTGSLRKWLHQREGWARLIRSPEYICVSYMDVREPRLDPVSVAYPRQIIRKLDQKWSILDLNQAF